LFNFIVEMGKKEGTGAVYGRGLKLVCLGLVIQKRCYVSYEWGPAGDANEHDDVILGFDR
jgi:hypothetical protein